MLKLKNQSPGLFFSLNSPFQWKRAIFFIKEVAIIQNSTGGITNIPSSGYRINK